ncbi:hypothetical protein FACS189487_09410 [Campylobacterota bacterium]|nr:hypothetical protein FACS189487_09410 [Campylobacterota bacterium]
MKIPLLQKTDIDYRNYFVDSISDEDDFFEMVEQKYPTIILDVFDHTLDAADPQIELLSNEYFRLCQEHKYLGFIEDVFAANGNQCYIEFVLDRNYEFIASTLEGMDRIDKLLFLHQVINRDSIARLSQQFNVEDKFCASHQKMGISEIYLIEDVNLLKMFLKGILRETFGCNSIYFHEKSLLLFSNYDLSIPIIIKNSDDTAMYKQIAHQHNLYFR